MSLELWLAFVAATLVFLLIPGPTLLLVIGYALSYGRKPAALLNTRSRASSQVARVIPSQI